MLFKLNLLATSLKTLNLSSPLIFKSLFALVLIALVFLFANYQKVNTLNSQLQKTKASIQKELSSLKNEDQYKKNASLQAEILNIEKTYKQALQAYEQILDAKAQKRDVNVYEKSFAQILNYLSERNYSSASASLLVLNNKMVADGPKASFANEVGSVSNVPINNAAPGSGYSRQKVHTDFGDFLVDIVAADLGSTRVIVDSASDQDCSNNCPVLSLGDYAGRSGAFAGVNGTYFCPAEYPSCAGKTNSFDTLIMNKNKQYINSANNVYSSVPAVIFQGTSVRYVGQALEWGRDTGVDGVLSNQPLLVANGSVVFGGDDEVKRATAGSRSFVGSTGSMVYIGVVHNVNAAQMARVLHAMGIQNALNLDSGGSVALWSGGYKVGPGRNIPNGILFVRK